MSLTIRVLELGVELCEVFEENLRILLCQVYEMIVLTHLIWVLELEREEVEENIPYFNLL